jgi:hypothetical protein
MNKAQNVTRRHLSPARHRQDFPLSLQRLLLS